VLCIQRINKKSSVVPDVSLHLDVMIGVASVSTGEVGLGCRRLRIDVSVDV
jgi:hypothetical protein